MIAVLGALARFGTTSLAGLAGAQAVLGPAVAVGPVLGAAATGLAALAVVAAAPRDWRGPAFGLLAGVLAMGPAATGWADALLRVTGALAGVGLVLAARRLPDIPRWVPMAAATAALGLAVVA